MSSGLGLGYYNPYYLLHHLTKQRLENTSFWEMIFAETGYKLVAKDYPVPLYDPLQLKVGFLLAPDAATQSAGQVR
jgi:2-ketoarginine methyltransferase